LITNGEELAKGIMIFQNVFINSGDYLKKIEDEGIAWEKAKIIHNGKYVEPDSNLRDTDIIHLPKKNKDSNGILSDLSKDFQDNITPYLNYYSEKYSTPIRSIENAQLLRYSKGQHLEEHVDRTRFVPRVLSSTYYIDDNYEGGEVEFVNFNLKVKSKKNQLLVFPSTKMYSHKVHPVISGSRHVIIQWAR
jgi:hypothetical protein